jgi:membrane peptidoglycan carboxypeptidase
MTRVESARKNLLDVRKTHTDQLGLYPLRPKSRYHDQLPSRSWQCRSLLKSSGKKCGRGRQRGIVGKTGTSSESRDLWFVGGGKDVVVAVWFGFDDMRYAIPGATGSALAAKLAGDFLRTRFSAGRFQDCSRAWCGMRVCPLSGRTASESLPACPQRDFSERGCSRRRMPSRY